jgi:hypothetical protein
MTSCPDLPASSTDHPYKAFIYAVGRNCIRRRIRQTKDDQALMLRPPCHYERPPTVPLVMSQFRSVP